MSGGVRVDARWICSTFNRGRGSGGGGEEEGERLAILVSTKKAGWIVVWPEGRGEVPDQMAGSGGMDTLHYDGGVGGEDASEDSLYDILTGRTPLPELGSTKQRLVRMDVDADAEESTRLDDTFREKKAVTSIDSDPDIF